MLLRRVAGHVKDQNWTAVGIDFAIVVVGVFIGLQVSNWNEARRENAGRQLYRAQLIGDLQQIEDRANGDVELYAERVLATSRVMEVLRSTGGTPGDPEQFERDLVTLRRASAPIPRSPTVVELISSGRMGAMAEHELRVEIVRFDQFIQAAERAAEVITDVWMRNTTPLQSRLSSVDRISDDGRELLSSRIEYDLEAMRGDPVLVPSLSAVLGVHLMEVEWRADIARRAAELRGRGTFSSPVSRRPKIRAAYPARSTSGSFATTERTWAPSPSMSARLASRPMRDRFSCSAPGSPTRRCGGTG